MTAFALPSGLSTHLASGALPVPGTYTAQPASPLGNAAQGQVGPAELCCVIQYTKNAGNPTGQPRFILYWVDENGTAFLEPNIDATAVVALEPFGHMKTYLGMWDGPIFDAVITNARWHYTFPIPPAARFFVLAVTELSAASGTIQIDYETRGVG